MGAAAPPGMGGLLPIRLRRIVRPDGTYHDERFVFCPRQHESIAPVACSACPLRARRADEDGHSDVACLADEPVLPPNPSSALGLHLAASVVQTGEAAAPVALCVQAGTSLSALSEEGGLHGRWMSVPVVDSEGVLAGSLNATALFADVRSSPFVVVEERMHPAMAVAESCPLAEAVEIMATHHLREVIAVDARGRVVGVLYDLDLLRWVARGAPPRW